MFWRKKTDGFDWHKHVRTTIKLKREARKQRLDDVVDAAMGGVKGAGRAGASAGAVGLEAANKAIVTPLSWLGWALATGLGLAAELLARPLAPAGRFTERPGVAPMLGLAAAVVGLLGLGRARVEGWDAIALVLTAGALAIVALLALPPLIAGRGPAALAAIAPAIGRLWSRIPGAGGLSVTAQRGLALGLVVVATGAAGWLGARAVGQLPTTALPSIPGFSRPPIEGTASALTGDTIRIGTHTLRLTGVVAPELDQQCGGQGREPRWKCGEAARTHLRELVRGKAVRCEAGSAGEDGVAAATCSAGGKDVGAELVARGHAFATQGLFSPHGRLEQDARAARRGIWRGTAERPEDYRARLWEAAKKAAPQGCPIKGQVSRRERRYVVPWQPAYAKVRIRPDRGERWFCTEQEALAAGFRPHGAT